MIAGGLTEGAPGSGPAVPSVLRATETGPRMKHQPGLQSAGREGRMRVGAEGALCRGDVHPQRGCPPPQANTGKSAAESMGLCEARRGAAGAGLGEAQSRPACCSSGFLFQPLGGRWLLQTRG